MRRLEQLELGLAVIVTALAIALHWHCVTHMGPLWRDEVNSVEIDSLPSVSDIWNNLQYDSYPMLWHCTLRSWLKLGFTSDAGLRLFGILIGTATISALWINARIFNHTSPLVALVLLELNATIIRWGDTIRGQGLSLLLSIGIPGAIWFLLKKPSYKSFFIALGLCLLAIHAQFYNVVPLFAAGVAGISVACVRRQYRGVVLIAGLGTLCVLSLVPYLPSIKQAGSSNIIITTPDFTFFWFLGKLSEAIGPLWGILDVCIWAGLFLAAGVATALITSQRCLKNPASDYVEMFFMIGALVCFAAYFIFLKILSYHTSPWYYIPLMGFSALALEGMLGSSRQKTFAAVRLAVGAILACLWFPWAWGNLGERLTNIDLVAEKIESSARSGDLIVINPWEPAITFQRYYKGDAPWVTVPPIELPKIHRWDELKKAMTMPDPTEAVAPVLSRIATALRAGDRVWLVGGAQFLPKGVTPLALPPAPNSRFGWQNVAYYEMWSEDIGYFVQCHALNASIVDVPVDGPVSQYESPPLVLISGWHE